MIDLEDIVIRLRRDCMSLIADEAADEIERLRNERDEARREVCSLTANWKHERFDVAKARGWDCFNEENTP